MTNGPQVDFWRGVTYGVTLAFVIWLALWLTFG